VKRVLLGLWARLVAALAIAGTVVACSLFAPAQSPSVAQQQAVDQAYAKVAVNILDSAWNAAADACVTVADAQGNGALLAKCQNILNPARDGLKAADDMIRAWQGGTGGSWACVLSGVYGSLKNLENVFKDAGVQVPPVVDSALMFASGFIPPCADSVDAGDGG